MKQFDLSVYKSSQPYFDLFDVYFKEYEIRKENYLIDNWITPSTYRQCRKGRYNMGFNIIKTFGTITIVITKEGYWRSHRNVTYYKKYQLSFKW